MHRAARMKSHALHRIMQRLQGECPGTVLRLIDEATDPLAVIDGEALYRITLTDGRCAVAAVRLSDRIAFTVMTTPCNAWVGNRLFHVTDTTIERIKNVNDPFRHNRRRIKRAKYAAQKRFL